MGWGRLLAENHRGRPVPRILWAPLDAFAVLATLLWRPDAARWGGLVGLLIVSAAGLVDDLAPAGPRGLRGHLRELASGRMTTGALKLLVAVGASVVVIAVQPPRPTWVRLAGIALIPACTNLWNGLDVAPGRAMKAFLPVGLAVWLAGGTPRFPALLGVLLGCVLALGLDVRERAMLGDAGSNPLGFAAGLGLYVVLPDTWVALAAAAAIGLNLVAETVTLSRLIRACPPLRMLDRLGRLADGSNGPGRTGPRRPGTC